MRDRSRFLFRVGLRNVCVAVKRAVVTGHVGYCLMFLFQRSFMIRRERERERVPRRAVEGCSSCPYFVT